MISARSVPPHAHPLPVTSCGERAPCTDCQRRESSLIGLLETTRQDLARAREAVRDRDSEILRLRAEHRIDSKIVLINVALLEREVDAYFREVR